MEQCSATMHKGYLARAFDTQLCNDPVQSIPPLIGDREARKLEPNMRIHMSGDAEYKGIWGQYVLHPSSNRASCMRDSLPKAEDKRPYSDAAASFWR